MKNKREGAVLVHDQLLQYGGAEKVLESLIELFPEAPIITSYYDSKAQSTEINDQKVVPLLNINKLIIKKLHKHLTILLPMLFEKIDLSEYNLVLSDGTLCPKGVITTPDQLHISYVHTPPRFLYGYSTESNKRNKWYYKPILLVIDDLLRLWDFHAAQKPDFILVNSLETQKRVQKFYRRDATVIYPPVEEPETISTQEITTELNNMQIPKNFIKEGFFFTVGRLAAYKNVDKIVNAFKELDMNLVVSGAGAELNAIEKLAEDCARVIVTGSVTQKQKNALFQTCRGFISAVENEDSGIAVLEPSFYGKPVLCHYSGGPKETVLAGVTGDFYTDTSIEGLKNSVQEFEQKISSDYFKADKIKSHSKKFSKVRFKKELETFVKQKMQERENQDARAT